MEDWSDSSMVENALIVKGFLDVFPDDLSGLHPDRDVEFVIDLVLGTRAISIAPYRMESGELKELKVQLQKFLNKGFIQPSVLP